MTSTTDQQSTVPDQPPIVRTAGRTPIPVNWDINFIFDKAQVYTRGEEVKDGVPSMLFDSNDLDAILAAKASYPVDYLEVMVPAMMAKLLSVRTAKSRVFSYDGNDMELTDYTNQMLTSAAFSLTLDTDETHTPWRFSDTNAKIMERDDFLEMAKLAARHVRRCFIAHLTIAQEIATAPDIYALEAIDIDGHEAWSS